ncbi:hypothetical protein AVEN_115971-1 [Araneus ventricosus]|uniref:Uncharacterized protein n=1 Tax=Araneus ventricosus TaxID=182803 RepID=A0A4Y2L8M1_ARAVE|nr:hypothetical protein AVEN_115971-1 [Araneus ventricosus]
MAASPTGTWLVAHNQPSRLGSGHRTGMHLENIRKEKEEQFLIQNTRLSFAIRISRNILVSHSSSLCRIRIKIHRSAEILTTRLRGETVLNTSPLLRQAPC